MREFFKIKDIKLMSINMLIMNTIIVATPRFPLLNQLSVYT